MKHIIIGTAGHVDHGKTTLIKALTGVDTDRLKEEQERGMTIDIGFAALKLPDGTVVGIVDVPGHERFLKNMLAGASGVDVVLLVIAADESVMPQTREHLDILRLLDVKNGVIALTKCDLVDRDWTDVVEEDVRAQLKGSFLANSPIVRVSSTTGKGLEALKKALLSAVSRAESRNAALPFRLPVDRVFTRSGFGTVVTGTLVSGTLHLGDAAQIVPQQIATRIRGLQIHGERVTHAEAGSRVAVNLVGIETEALGRGAQLAPPDVLTPTDTFDGVLRLLTNTPRALKDRARVHLHIGTAAVLGRIRLLDARDALEPGERAYIQFRAEEPLACARGDRFVVRSYSPMQTIGGGTVLEAQPSRHRKADNDTLQALEAKERGTPEDLIETILQRAPMGVLEKDLAAQSGLPQEEALLALVGLTASQRVVSLPGSRLVYAATYRSLTDRAEACLQKYHQQFPLRSGMPKEELRGALGKEMDPKSYAALLSQWQAEKRIVVEGAGVRLADFRVQLNPRQEALLNRIEIFYRSCGIAIPPIPEVCRDVKAPPDAVEALLKVGVEQGRFHRVADGLYYTTETIQSLQELARTLYCQQGTITVGAFRDLTQSNRKNALTALEYFDTIHFTRRQGDERTVIESRED